jgi:hypothetical protein
LNTTLTCGLWLVLPSSILRKNLFFAFFVFLFRFVFRFFVSFPIQCPSLFAQELAVNNSALLQMPNTTKYTTGVVRVEGKKANRDGAYELS